MQPEAPRLAGTLDSWSVMLVTGDVVEVRAHGVKEEAADLVFVALVEGSPPSEQVLLRVPIRAVAEWQGG